MNQAPFLPGFVQRVERLSATAEQAGGLDAAMRMALRLNEALRRLASEDPTVPVVRVVLLGGTGVGKSALFNALIGQSQASPTSDDIRCFTRRPHIAVSARDRPLLNIPRDLQPEFVQVDLDGIALIDTPDIDGALQENWHVTRALVRRADIVVYVTMPDRRSEFQVHQEVRAWASLKRWLFVLNKADQVARVVEPVREDFDRRLRELGFQPHDGVRFVVSATQWQAYDFARMRDALFNTRVVESVEKLRADGFLGYTAHALDPDVTRPLQHRLEELTAFEAEWNARIRQVYRDSLNQPLARHAFRVVVRELAWRYLGERVGWLMGLAIWIRARLSLLGASYQVARLGAGGFSPLGMARAALAVVYALLRGILPLQRILSAMGPAYRQELHDIEDDAQRFLEDRQLTGLAPAVPATTVEDARGGPPAEEHRDQNATWNRASRWLRESLLDDRQELEHLQADLENLGQKTADRVGPWPLAVLSNLLPTAFAAHVLWRIGFAWYAAEYPPAAFYALAVALLLASLLPGYLLLAFRMRRICRRLDPRNLADSVEHPLATARVRAARQRLDEFLRETLRLRHTLYELRRELDLELPSAATVRTPPDGPAQEPAAMEG